MANHHHRHHHLKRTHTYKQTQKKTAHKVKSNYRECDEWNE